MFKNKRKYTVSMMRKRDEVPILEMNKDRLTNDIAPVKTEKQMKQQMLEQKKPETSWRKCRLNTNR